MTKKREIQFSEYIKKLYSDEFEPEDKIISITFQVLDTCNLRCTYCYQIEKKNHKMTFEQAKSFIDYLLDLEEENEYLNPKQIKGYVFEFIGGEPFLNVELVDQITEYIIDKMIREHRPELFFSKFSICSNGTLLFEDKVQKYIHKYKNFLSLSVSLDGNKELHDKCRVFPDGSGSYDAALKAAYFIRDFYGKMPSTKMTLSPNNITYTYDAITNLFNLGYEEIHANVVFEEGWTLDHAKIFYNELIKLADYILDNKLYETVRVSLFEEQV